MTIAIESPEKQDVETTWTRFLLHGAAGVAKPCDSKNAQNRVRFQIAAVRISISDVMKDEQREYWEENYHAPNDMRGYRGNDRWLFPVAMRAASSHNLESRHTDKNKNDVVLDPRLTPLQGSLAEASLRRYHR